MEFRRSLAVLLANLVLAVGGCSSDADAPRDAGDGGLDVSVDGPAGTDGTSTVTEIVVTTPSGVTAFETRDGYCDILEAAAAVARGQSVDDCENPNGATRIVLQPGRTYPVRKTLRLAAGTEIGIPAGT